MHVLLAMSDPVLEIRLDCLVVRQYGELLQAFEICGLALRFSKSSLIPLYQHYDFELLSMPQALFLSMK